MSIKAPTIDALYFIFALFITKKTGKDTLSLPLNCNIRAKKLFNILILASCERHTTKINIKNTIKLKVNVILHDSNNSGVAPATSVPSVKKKNEDDIIFGTTVLKT